MIIVTIRFKLKVDIIQSCFLHVRLELGIGMYTIQFLSTVRVDTDFTHYNVCN